MKATEIINDELLVQLINRAWESESFKQDLVKDPLKTIEDFSGKKISIKDTMKLVIRDQTDESTVYINIPSQEYNGEVELDDNQLDMISGGSVPPIII